jgi:hypothetical protein
MTKWLVLLIAIYFSPLIILSKFCSNALSRLNSDKCHALIEFRHDRFGEHRRAREVGLVAAYLLFVLAILSFPIGMLHDALIGKPAKGANEEETKQNEQRQKWKIYLWILGWLVFDCLILFFKIGNNPWYVVFPLMRLCDLVYVLVRLPVLGQGAWRRGRALVFLIIHYWEVVITFACVYLFLQYLEGSPVFCGQGKPFFLSITDAVYFSFITASTVGYGDITPCMNINNAPHFLPGARPLVEAEVFFLLLIVGFDLAHIIGVSERSTKVAE